MPASRRRKTALWWHCSEDEWYERSIAHWSACDDVLGGCGSVDGVDLSGSLHFLRAALGSETAPAGSLALDLGAGSGRVSGGVLLKVFERVHLVEVSAPLLQAARTALCDDSSRLDFTLASLREFVPPAGTYDAIWAQWILGHLTDHSVVRLLAACHGAVRPGALARRPAVVSIRGRLVTAVYLGGLVVVKENTAPPKKCREGRGNYMLDAENAAVLRTHAHHMALFRRAGYRVVKSTRQADFPSDIYPVRMYLLAPRVSATEA